jgi:hypothetical protein
MSSRCLILSKFRGFHFIFSRPKAGLTNRVNSHHSDAGAPLSDSLNGPFRFGSSTEQILDLHVFKISLERCMSVRLSRKGNISLASQYLYFGDMLCLSHIQRVFSSHIKLKSWSFLPVFFDIYLLLIKTTQDCNWEFELSLWLRYGGLF